MVSPPITSWQTDGENSGNSNRFYFLGLQNHCRQWLQSWNEKSLAPWKKSYDKPRKHIKKQIRYFADKGPHSQSYGFSSSHVRMLELDHNEGWVLKNWCFELWYWRKLLRILWTARRSNQSIIKKINPEYSLKDWSWRWNSNILATHWNRSTGKDWLTGKDPDAGKNWGAGEEGSNRLWVGWIASPTQWKWVWANSRILWRTVKPGALQSIGSQRVGHDWVTEQKHWKLSFIMITHIVQTLHVICDLIIINT